MLYVTERCVFRLTPDGLELIEIAPGIDLDKDVLAHVGFTPIINAEPKLMDRRLFLDEPMGLKDDLLTVPLDARFTYDAERNIFFINMEALSVSTAARGRGHRRRDREEAGRGRQEGPRRGQLRQLLPGARTSPTPTPPRSAALPNASTTASPATPPAPSCASSWPAISPSADWPRTSTKATKKPWTGSQNRYRAPIQAEGAAVGSLGEDPSDPAPGQSKSQVTASLRTMVARQVMVG